MSKRKESKSKRFVKSFDRISEFSFYKPKKRKLRENFWKDVGMVIKKEGIADLSRFDFRKKLSNGQKSFISRILNARLERPGGSFIPLKKKKNESKRSYNKRRQVVTGSYMGDESLPINGIFYSPPKKDQKVTGNFDEKGKLKLDQVVTDPLTGRYGKPTFHPVDKDQLAIDPRGAVLSAVNNEGLFVTDNKGNFKNPFYLESLFGTGAGSKFRKTIYNLQHLDEYVDQVTKNQADEVGSGGCVDEKLGGNKYLDAFIITGLKDKGEQKWKKMSRRNRRKGLKDIRRKK